MSTIIIFLISIGLICYGFYLERRYLTNQLRKERRYDTACKKLAEWKHVHRGYDYHEQFEEYDDLMDEYIQASIERIKIDSFSYQSGHLINLLKETSNEKHHQQILNLLFQNNKKAT